MGTVTPLFPTARADGFYGDPILLTLPDGWVRLVEHYRYGPDADGKDVRIVQGEFFGDTGDHFLVQVEGTVQRFVKELREAGDGSRIVRHGWVMSRG